MIVACTGCKTRFEAAGYRDVHCPGCGALAQQASMRPCPRCELPLQARQVSDVVIDECSGCQGLFLDVSAVARVVDGTDMDRAAALLAALPRRTPQPMTGARMYIKCPTCGTVMNRKLFATGSGVVIDVCKTHGTFFDAGELPTIIDFVQRGGLDIAAKKDAAREQQQKVTNERARERARAMINTGYHGDEGVALVDLLTALFK
jgi:Zn-finger nucleic acid-binding protein